MSTVCYTVVNVGYLLHGWHPEWRLLSVVISQWVYAYKKQNIGRHNGRMCLWLKLRRHSLGNTAFGCSGTIIYKHCPLHFVSHFVHWYYFHLARTLLVNDMDKRVWKITRPYHNDILAPSVSLAIPFRYLKWIRPCFAKARLVIDFKLRNGIGINSMMSSWIY